MSERITLDPDSVAVDRTELEINEGPITVRVDGVDWGNAEIEAVMADQERGSAPVDYRLPNRQITIPLKIRADGTVSFDQARGMLQKKVSLLQREGGWIGRVINGGGTVYADVVNAGLTLGGGWLQAHKEMDADAELRLEVIPDFYEDEIALSDHSETTLPELKFTETDIRGDYPARVRILVDEDDAEDQGSLIWAMRSRHYVGNDDTKKVVYQAEELDPLDIATASGAVTGASGGTAVIHSDIAEEWTPVLGTDIAGGFPMQHTGAYRVYARFRSYGGTMEARLVWDVGDLLTPTENPPVEIPTTTGFYMLDLGEVRLDKIQTGVHWWGGQIQCRGGGSIAIDRLWMFNIDEGFGVAQAAPPATTLTPFVARDGFTHVAGTLAGKTLPIGGTWAGAGDANEFVLNTTNRTAQRTATADSSGLANGRFELGGTAVYDEVSVQANFQFTAPSTADEFLTGVVARYTNTSNFALAYIQKVASGSTWTLNVVTQVSGATTWWDAFASPYFGVPNTDHRIKFAIDVRGNYYVYWGLPDLGVEPRRMLTGFAPDLAAGEALDDGRVGFFDQVTGSTPATRQVDNFLVTAPAPDAACFASQSLELSTWGIVREASGGTVYGPVSRVFGDLPRLPAAGIEDRTTEVMLKLSRGNLADSPDSGIDDLSAQVFYRPSWLYLPD